jgi:serine/threonine protein kinase
MNANEPNAPTPALEQLGRYLLLKKLGQGGMGTVYLAWDNRLNRRVALKVLPPHSLHDPAAVRRFQREAQALAQLSHPGIVQAHDADAEGERHFLVMEYVEGHSLAQLLKDKGRLPPTQAADYLYQAALALQHAHDKGLIHRDLKPANLLLTQTGRVKVLDLGLARFLQDQLGDPGLTREGVTMGTPDYAAPEQFRDARSADVRSDIYSLGCSLYQLLTGQVPFPGSSLEEKYRAHEQGTPPPLEELCPEAPAGLTLVVQRMMAKAPAERFQSAQEVADALAPYAASATALVQLKQATRWDRGQLTLSGAPAPVRPARFTKRLLAEAVVAVVLVIGTFFATRLLSPEDSSEEPRLTQTTPGADKGNKGQQPSEKGPEKEPALTPAPRDANVLTVSKDPKDGGEFRTINQALEKVKPGMIIRVLDDATYSEPLSLRRASTQTGITLEAPRRATLALKMPLDIRNVPKVTVSGFRFRAATDLVCLTEVLEHSPGVVLERLEFEPGQTAGYAAVLFQGVLLSKTEAPVILRDCTVRGAMYAVSIMGIANDHKTVFPTSNICIHNNTLVDCTYGVLVSGEVSRLQVTGNRIWGAKWSAVELYKLLPRTEEILIANNTAFECSAAFRLGDTAVRKGVQLRNNLVLAATLPDILFLIIDKPRVIEGPGDGKLLHQFWQVDHNWREVKEPAGADTLAKAWVPPGAKDVRQDEIKVLSRDPSKPNFLRPARNSPLATEGAGKTDPSLPSYVGAVPPEGVQPWDWSRTWRMPKGAQLLTVSKALKDGGTYRTLGAALDDAKPWATIRVLDDATYKEVLVLDDPERHEGILLEAPRRATLWLPERERQVLAIRGVLHVRVKGFRFREAAALAGTAFVTVTDHAAGVVLEELDLAGGQNVDGIILANSRSSPAEPPLVVRKCTLRVGFDGIALRGQVNPGAGREPAGGVLVHDNHIKGGIRGICLQGAVHRVQVTGNVVGKCNLAALQIEDPGPGTERILLANNTGFDSGAGFRLWDNSPYEKLQPGQVEVRNNVFFNNVDGDLLFVLDEGNKQYRAGDGKELVRLWRFGYNGRDWSGNEPNKILPAADADQRLGKLPPSWRDTKHPDFLRPPKSSPLVDQGAGRIDPSLPAYIGAVPPAGLEPWDWERTWRSRMRKAVKAPPP